MRNTITNNYETNITLNPVNIKRIMGHYKILYAANFLKS